MNVTLNRPQRMILLGLLLFTLFFRLATLMMIHTGVDERDYWFSAKTLAHGLPYPDLSHRTTRWSIILPVAAAQLILGSHPDVYYVLPVIACLGLVALAFVIGVRLRGTLTGFLAGLGLALFPYMVRAGSQVRPEIFSVPYVLLAFLCFFRYLEKSDHEIRPLIWTAVWLFIAWESKVTNVYFLPGMLLAIVLYKKKASHLLILGGAVLALLIVETAAYAAFTPYKLGELEIILTHHLESATPLLLDRFVDLFRRYSSENLRPYWQVPFVLFAGAALYVLARKEDKRVATLVWGALWFFLGMTFEVAGLHPIHPAESFLSRYFSAVLGPVALVLAWTVEGVIHGKEPSSSLKYNGALAALAVVVLVVFSLPRLPSSLRMYANSPLKPMRHPLLLNETYRREVNASFQAGPPIVAADDNGGSNALETCRYYFFDLGSYVKGAPPPYLRISYANRTILVLSRLPARIAGADLVAALRTPFRLVALPADRIGLLTNDSTNGTQSTADDENQ